MADEILTQNEIDAKAPKGEVGLSPGVKQENVPEAQKSNLADPGIPKTPADQGQKNPEPTPVPTPAPTPAPTEAPKPDEAPAEEYKSYGDAGVDAAVGMLKEAGIKPAEAETWFREAADSGDLTKIKADEIIKKLGEQKGNLVLSAVKTYYTNETAKVNEQVNKVLAVFDGKENFETVKAWAAKKGETDEAFFKQMAEYVQMMDKGGESARLASVAVRGLYEADPKNKSLTVKMVQGDSVDTLSSAESMNRQEYLAKVKAADAKGDYAEVARLRSLRSKAISAGR